MTDCLGESKGGGDDVLLNCVNLLDHCPFCFRVVETKAKSRRQESSTQVKRKANQDCLSTSYSNSYIWSHLLGKLQRSCCEEGDDGEEEAEFEKVTPPPQPKMINFIVNKTPKKGTNKNNAECSEELPVFCDVCQAEVSQLQELHKELGEVLRKFNTQVVQVRKIIGGSLEKRVGFQELLRSRTDLGNEQIKCTLRFLKCLKNVDSTEIERKIEKKLKPEDCSDDTQDWEPPVEYEQYKNDRNNDRKRKALRSVTTTKKKKQNEEMESEQFEGQTSDEDDAEGSDLEREESESEDYPNDHKSSRSSCNESSQMSEFEETNLYCYDCKKYFKTIQTLKSHKRFIHSSNAHKYSLYNKNGTKILVNIN